MACLLPISIRNKKDGGTMAAPCGSCPECRQRRINSWVFRLQQEEKRHKKALFATLTYDPESIPISTNGFMTLDRTHLQKFFKRLRKRTQIKTIKYYACGEYGSKTRRPHYHMIIFDVTHDQIEQAWYDHETKKPIGYIHTGQVTGESIAYTCKYMYKPSQIGKFEMDDRVREFSLMSKNMGANFLTPAMIQYYEARQVSTLTLPGGYTQALPRYYRDRIFSDAEKENMNAKMSSKYNEDLLRQIQEAGGELNYIRNRYESMRQRQQKMTNHQRNKI